jgi:hypothetical protein
MRCNRVKFSSIILIIAFSFIFLIISVNSYPTGSHSNGTEWIGSDGGTYVYDDAIGGWSTMPQISVVSTYNGNGSSNMMNYGFAAFALTSKMDGPSPGLDYGAAVGLGITAIVASGMYVREMAIDDYTVTVDEPLDPLYVTLYRGVHYGHPDYKNALLGIATPIGGHDDPILHNWGDNASVFTSWTVLSSVARIHASKVPPSNGVLLEKRFRLNEIIPSPDKYKEGEFLVPGIVTGASVIIPK